MELYINLDLWDLMNIINFIIPFILFRKNK